MPVLNVDLSRIPESLEGHWVVFRVSDSVALGSGDSPNDALSDAMRTADDPSILLVKVPSSRTPISA